MTLSAVIPALNEAAALPALLADLRALGDALGEVVVADAGSSDGTAAVATAGGARVVHAPRGRARQLNAGAQSATGDWLLFLHADSRVGPDARAAIQQVLAGVPPVEAAIFRFAIDLPPGWRWFIESGQSLRESLTGLAYGDQGLLVRRDCFEAVGGYPELPLMEDVVIVRRLRNRFGLTRLPAPVLTSGRRYVQRGILRTWLTHSLLISLYMVGVPPARLARWRDGGAAHAR
jgi:rSAM/selenodomain-associated transferase 2